MPKIEQRGKQFSKRTIEVHETEYGPIELIRINWCEEFTPKTLDRYRQQATEVLETYSIPVGALLTDAPHGSMVRDYVLNHAKHEHDSLPALAARILETILHMQADEYYKRSLAYRLGRMTMLFDVYQIYGPTQAARRKGKPLADIYDTSRDDRLQNFHTRLAASGAKDATKQTANEFGISDRQVRSILKKNSARK